MTIVRNAIAAQMIATLEAAEFGGSSSNASANAQVSSLITQANALLAHAKALAQRH